jgi:hypothetical protein
MQAPQRMQRSMSWNSVPSTAAAVVEQHHVVLSGPSSPRRARPGEKVV